MSEFVGKNKRRRGSAPPARTAQRKAAHPAATGPAPAPGPYYWAGPAVPLQDTVQAKMAPTAGPIQRMDPEEEPET